jgi:uncharacterized spore protein YtfJ
MFLPIVKAVVGLGAGVSVFAVTKLMVKAATPETMSKVGKVLFVTGGTLLPWMMSAAATEYTDKTIDDVVSVVKVVKGDLSKHNSGNGKNKRRRTGISKSKRH